MLLKHSMNITNIIKAQVQDNQDYINEYFLNFKHLQGSPNAILEIKLYAESLALIALVID